MLVTRLFLGEYVTFIAKWVNLSLNMKPIVEVFINWVNKVNTLRWYCFIKFYVFFRIYVLNCRNEHYHF